MKRRPGAVLGAFVAAIGVACATLPADASERLPDWITLSKTLGPTGADHGGAFPDEAQRGAWKAEGHGYVDLVWNVAIHVERSGAIETRVETVRHFLTDSGIAQGGNMEFWGDAARDTVTIETAYSIAPGEPAHPIDPDTIELTRDTAADVFSDYHRILLPLPGLRPGNNATVVGKRRFDATGFPLHWSRIVSLANVMPISRIDIVVTREPDAPKLAWATNDPELACSDDAEARRLRCLRTNVPAFPLDRDVASYRDLVPHLFVGIEETWEGVRRKVRAMVDEAARPNASVSAQAAALVESIETGTGASDEAILWALLRFVADDIRYVSMAHGDSTVVPHDADVTLSRRYGDCKDKVTLLVAMGRSVGIEVTPVLTSSEFKRTASVLEPSSSYFDHMIGCLDTQAGERVCVDPTQAYSGLSVPPAIGGAIALAIGEVGPPTLENLAVPRFGWEVELRRELALEAGGRLAVRDVRRFGGPGAAGFRSEMLALSAGDRVAWAEAEHRDAVGGNASPQFTFRSLRDAASPYEIESSHVLPGAWQPAALALFEVDAWLVYYARNMISSNRHHPYTLLGLRYRAEEVVTPCCVDIRFHGPELDFESKYGSLRRTYRKVDGRIIANTVLELPAATIPPDELPALETFIMQSLRESGIWLTWPAEDR